MASWGVLLWWEHRRHADHRALETLLAYNIADAVNLEPLMVHAYNRKLGQTRFADTHRLALPIAPAPPFQAEREAIEKVLGIAARQGMEIHPDIA
jgi:hypothetical protein